MVQLADHADARDDLNLVLPVVSLCAYGLLALLLTRRAGRRPGLAVAGLPRTYRLLMIGAGPDLDAARAAFERRVQKFVKKYGWSKTKYIRAVKKTKISIADSR